jgi:tetratricopeptide (TPR) repeat protein
MISSLRGLLFIPLLLTVTAFSAEPTPRETQGMAQAARFEQAGDWLRAGNSWEQVMLMADLTGDYDRTIAHGERALAAWSHGIDQRSLDGQAFALGVISKVEIRQGRLTLGRERNLAALRLIERRITEASGWKPVPGQVPPAGIRTELLEAWARGYRDTADWLDAQGRTVEAVELLTAAERSMRAAAPGGFPNGLYHRKLLSSRASFLKFLGYQERAIRDLQQLVETSRPEQASIERPQRFNLAYYSFQFYGPKPEYLAATRQFLQEEEAEGKRSREGRRLMAKMAFAYSKAGLDVQDLEQLIEEAKADGAELDSIYAERDLAVLKVDAGRRDGVEAGLLKALGVLRRKGIKRGEPTLYREYGQFLVKEGRATEGLRMLREAVRMTRSFGWTQHLPNLLANVAAAQGLVGDIDGLARTLAELDTLIRGGALIPEREFIAHCARARALLLLGRNAEAAAAIAKATAVADRAGLNEHQRFALSWTQDVKPVAPTNVLATKDTPKVDLQPVAIIATAEPGGTAVARFRLSNPGSQIVEGTLQITGREATIRFDPVENVATVVASAAEGSAHGGVPMQIGTGEEILIKVEAAVGAGDGSVRLRWESGEHSATAVCHLRAASAAPADQPGATVTNTSLAWKNPFYAVAFHHPLRVVGGPHSFRVQASQRCRVEMFDAQSGALLAVDADGDGAFRSAGDSVANDANGDAFPELPAEPTTGRGELEILVFPLAGSGPNTEEIRIEVQTKTTQGWNAVAHDTLKPPPRR